jgi:hypothetical protein
MDKVIRWEEALLLQDLAHNEWHSQPLTNEEKAAYQAAVKYTQSLNEKSRQPFAFHYLIRQLSEQN